MKYVISICCVYLHTQFPIQIFFNIRLKTYFCSQNLVTQLECLYFKLKQKKVYFNYVSVKCTYIISIQTVSSRRLTGSGSKLNEFNDTFLTRHDVTLLLRSSLLTNHHNLKSLRDLSLNTYHCDFEAMINMIQNAVLEISVSVIMFMYIYIYMFLNLRLCINECMLLYQKNLFRCLVIHARGISWSYFRFSPLRQEA